MINFSRPSNWKCLEGSCHEVGHTWSSSCVYSSLELGWFCFLEGIKIYLPLRVISDIARGSLIKNLKNGSLLKDVLRSSVFLCANGCSIIFWHCFVRYILRRYYRYSIGFVPGFLSSACAILVEKKNRRGLLAGYTSVVAFEFLNSLFRNNGLEFPLPYGDVLLFSCASSYIFYHFKTHKASGDFISSFLRVLISPPLPHSIVRKLHFPVMDNQLLCILMVGAWGFLLGYLIQTILLLIGQLSKLCNYKETMKVLYQMIYNQRGAQFGAFLGSLSAGFLAANFVLKHFPMPRAVRLLLAGFLAGFAALFYRSNSLTFYMTWKSFELLFFEGVRLGYYKSWYYGDVLLFALSCGTIYHAALLHGHLLRPAFWNFLLSGTGGRLSQLDYDQLDHFGTHASKKPSEECIKAHKKKMAAGISDVASKIGSWEPAEVSELRARCSQLQTEPKGIISV